MTWDEAMASAWGQRLGEAAAWTRDGALSLRGAGRPWAEAALADVSARMDGLWATGLPDLPGWLAAGPWLAVGAASVCAVALLLFVAKLRGNRRALRRSRAAVPLADEMLRAMAVQRAAAIGLAVLFVGGFVAWAATFELASGAVASGVISPDGARRPVQHFEGGIVSAVLVRDGDRVAKGEPLLVLEEVRAASRLREVADQQSILRVRLARLAAERGLQDAFEPRPVAGADADLRAAIDHEREQFGSRQGALEGRRAQLRTQEAQLREEIAGLTDRIASLDVQTALLADELADVRTLLDKGLERRSRLLSLQREASALEGERAGAAAQIARARQAIAEVATQEASLEAEHLERADRETADVRAELVRLNSERALGEDVLGRTTIVAPEAGRVVGLKVTSAQAVISPGDVLLEIVPEEAELLIDAQLSPMDVDDVREGQRAQVHLLAYKQRNMPRVEGVVRHVSADRYLDERTGAPYFLARVAVDADLLHSAAPGVEILAGMPADMVIRTGEQTMLNYLVGPLLMSLNRSFRES